MHKKLMTIMLAMLLLVGGLSLVAGSAEANCGKCAAGKGPSVCDKCKKAGKKSCDCHKPKVCAKCKKAGKKSCDCHKH